MAYMVGEVSIEWESSAIVLVRVAAGSGIGG
jgi:hypothetical protein